MAAQTLADLLTIASGHVLNRLGRYEAMIAKVIATAVVGDSGSGGKIGMVPAPGTGDAAANKFLKADGTWSKLGYASKGSILALSSKTVASNAITLSIPANTLQSGDVIRISGGAATDGGSSAVTVTLTAGGATVASSGSDSNTGAHQWVGGVTLFYDGANFITATSSISDGASAVTATGASNAFAASGACSVTVTSSNAHATPSALFVEVVRP